MSLVSEQEARLAILGPEPVAPAAISSPYTSQIPPSMSTRSRTSGPSPKAASQFASSLAPIQPDTDNPAYWSARKEFREELKSREDKKRRFDDKCAVIIDWA
ncbi:hypothetical protein SEPCBS57363_004330 [Sporothrix epigloea]|uniref:Uncharacterized protein n=1 Tax=Sporothrix epigloea TaxID=1892477 RepID=A0ABP0DSP2_9PEZI